MNADEIIMLGFVILILITTPIAIWFKSQEENEDNYIGTKKRK